MKEKTSLVQKYARLHVRGLLAVCREIIVRTDGATFARLFNLKSRLMGGSVRMSWQNGLFVVSDAKWPEIRYKFNSTRVGNNYQFGLLERGQRLGTEYMLDKIDFKDGDIVFDCGANVGNMKLWFRLHGIDVHYVGFEPSPVEFRCLVHNVAPSKVFNLGLWNREDVLRFYVASGNSDSSLIEPAHYDEVIEVQTKRLDGFLTEKIKCLKLEAEGAEPEILEGAGDKLNLIEYVAADCGYERGVDEESTLAPVTNFLLSRGFELVAMNHTRICALYRNTRFNP